MFTKKTIRDIDLAGKAVLMRADYNVPVEDGKITDDYRIKQSVPTIQYLLEKNVRLIICSHLGRPDGKPDTKDSLAPVAQRLGELIGSDKVQFVHDCVGPEVTEAAKALQPGHVLLLENLRFHPEEEKNDDAFASQLASLAEVFVQDGFGVVHRAHASTDAVTRHLPAVAGFLLEKEVDTITNVMENPKRPLMAVVGGAKISDKIEILQKFIDIADVVVVGGAMANTFLAAQGVPVGKSMIEADAVNIAKDIVAKAQDKAKREHFVFYLPQDGVVATSIDKTVPTRIVGWHTHVVADIESYPKQAPQSAGEVASDEMILDIGPVSSAFISGSMQLANTVVWNGTLGVAEAAGLQGPVGPYAHGTKVVLEAVLGSYGHRPFSLAGGGDTAAYIAQAGLVDAFDHVSTGGGASLELMAGRKLPGVEALRDN
jgi:phosphoglycerate kinase